MCIVSEHLFNILLMQEFAIIIWPLNMPGFSCGYWTVHFKCPLWDSVFLYGQKGCTFTRIALPCSFGWKGKENFCWIHGFMTYKEMEWVVSAILPEERFDIFWCFQHCTNPGCLIFMGCQYGTFFMSPFCHLEFKVALDLWKICVLLEFIKILVCYSPT